MIKNGINDMKKMKNLLLFLLIFLSTSVFADRIETEKIIVSNNFVVASNFICMGTTTVDSVVASNITVANTTITNFNQITSNVVASVAAISNTVFYGVKKIETTAYDILQTDNNATLVHQSSGAATYILPTITNEPFGFYINIVKNSTDPIQIAVTNKFGVLFDGTNVYNNSSAKLHSIGLRCVETNTWIIEQLNGNWSTKWVNYQL